ncbi:MAG: hypothetical protein AAGE99_03450 [Chlamydiota bacterium]
MVPSLERNEKLSRIRCTAAEVLATAVFEHDAKTFPIKGGETPWGFYFDFIFTRPFSKEALPYIEEKMARIAADNVEIKIHEMIASNAAALLRHGKHPYPAHFAQTCNDPLVRVIQIGTFFDHVQGTFLRKTGELRAFKLLQLEQRPHLYFKGDKKSVHRITGVADETKDRLKAFIRKYQSRLGVDHLAIGQRLNLFAIDLQRRQDYFETAKIYWRREGEALLHRIHSFWRKEHLKRGFELVITDSDRLTEAHEKLYRLSKKRPERGAVCLAEFSFAAINGEFSPIHGLLGSKICHRDRSHIFCLKKDLTKVLHSSLILLNNIPKMFDLGYSVEISCPDELVELFKRLPIEEKIHPALDARIEWKLYDDFGRSWKGPFLTVRKEGELFTVKRSLFSSVERLIGLLLEAQEKDLSRKKELLDKIGPFDR